MKKRRKKDGVRARTKEGIWRVVRNTIAHVLRIKPKTVQPGLNLKSDLYLLDEDLSEVLTVIERKLHIFVPDKDEWSNKMRTVALFVRRVLACFRKEHGKHKLITNKKC
jgi:hypothetical protein